jgi:hypothetical protein
LVRATVNLAVDDDKAIPEDYDHEEHYSSENDHNPSANGRNPLRYMHLPPTRVAALSWRLFICWLTLVAPIAQESAGE